jgi:hypothetical protein
MFPWKLFFPHNKSLDEHLFGVNPLSGLTDEKNGESRRKTVEKAPDERIRQKADLRLTRV